MTDLPRLQPKHFRMVLEVLEPFDYLLCIFVGLERSKIRGIEVVLGEKCESDSHLLVGIRLLPNTECFSISLLKIPSRRRFDISSVYHLNKFQILKDVKVRETRFLATKDDLPLGVVFSILRFGLSRFRIFISTDIVFRKRKRRKNKQKTRRESVLETKETVKESKT